MACKTRESYVDSVAKKFIEELKKTHKELGGPAIKTEAYKLAELVVTESEERAREDLTPVVLTALKANATTQVRHKDSEMPIVAIPNDILKRHAEYNANPSAKTTKAILDIETAHDYRNADGELLVKFNQQPIIGSKGVKDEMSADNFEDYFIDIDGSMDKSARVNEALISIDKENLDTNFNEDHSVALTSIIGEVTKAVSNLNDRNLKIQKSTLKNVIEAEGTFNPVTGDISLRLDTHGPGAAFRNKFSMTNQEVYAHELVHAALSYIWDKANKDVANNTDVIAFTAALQELYEKAKKESTWKSLLPGLDNGVQYTTLETAEAVAKWDYIFKNKDGYGLHEFAAAVLTNANFRESMEAFGALSTIKPKANETLADTIRRWFNNILEKIFGYASSKHDNSITKEATTLLTRIMRANSNATERVATRQAISTIGNAMEVLGDKLDAGNELVRKVTDPFIGVLDSIESTIGQTGDKALPKETVQEFIALQAKLTKILDGISAPINASNKFTATILGLLKILNVIQKTLRAMPTIYKMRNIVKDNSRNKAMAKRMAITTNQMLEAVNLAQDGMVRNIGRLFIDRPGMYNYLADAMLKLTRAVDHTRQSVYEGVKDEVREAFGDVKIDNDRLNATHNEALTSVVLRTDMQSLGLDAKGLTELLSDPNEVSKKIAEFSKGLSKEHITDASEMAYNMVNGTPTGNAEQIARGFGRASTTSGKSIVEQIDKLISYMALDMTSTEEKASLLSFLNGDSYVDYGMTMTGKFKKSIGIGKVTMTKEEYIGKVEEGVNNFINLAVGLNAASIDEMSKNPLKRIKGYIKETYSKDISVEAFPLSERVQLEKDGYTFVREVRAVDGSITPTGLFINNSPTLGRANGALGLQDKKARGFSLRDLVQREAGLSDAKWDKVQSTKKFNELLESTRSKYLADRKSVDMQPVFDDYGTIIDFRVTMSLAEKKELLGLELRGDINIARSYSVMGLSTATAKHNDDVLRELYKDYKANYNEDTKIEYVTIEAKELTASDYGLPIKKTAQNSYDRYWARLPSSTKIAAAEIFGSEKIVIRKDLLTMAFGDDNYSITQNALLNNISPKNKAMLMKIEAVVQDIMQIAKSNIVIKLPEVVTGNLMSNLKTLTYLGVHPVKGVKLMLTAVRELKRYEDDSRELAKLRRKELAGLDVDKGYLIELESRIASNTASPLIEAGLYQSVVEDVSTADESNRVAQWFEDKTDKYVKNETANTAIQYMFLTKRTKPYQQLLKLTQVSDFYFRYVQYYDALDKGVTKYAKAEAKKVDGYKSLNKEEIAALVNKLKSEIPESVMESIKARAMRDAIDNYINYEAPLEKHIRYGDAMGAWFFVKYFIRIQKVVKKVAKENPLRMGADIALQHFVTGDTSDIQEASFLTRGISTFNPLKIFDRFYEAIEPAGLELGLRVF